MKGSGPAGGWGISAWIAAVQVQTVGAAETSGGSGAEGKFRTGVLGHQIAVSRREAPAGEDFCPGGSVHHRAVMAHGPGPGGQQETAPGLQGNGASGAQGAGGQVRAVGAGGGGAPGDLLCPLEGLVIGLQEAVFLEALPLLDGLGDEGGFQVAAGDQAVPLA